MKYAGIEVSIGRLVVDASSRGDAAGLADAIGAALRERISQSAVSTEAASAQRAPSIIADRIATRLSATIPRSSIARGSP